MASPISSRGWILHHHPYRDTSLLLEVLTDTHGRVGMVARGGKRNGRQRGLLAPFQPLLLRWSGRGELRTMQDVDAEQWRAPPAGRNLLGAYYCNEVLLRVLRRDEEEPGVFAAYSEVIDALQEAGPAAPSLRRFELKLLDALGYAPPLTQCAESGEPIQADRQYDFHPDSGPHPARTGMAVAGVPRLSGAHLLQIANHDFSDPAVLRAAQPLLRASLTPLLGDRPLHTRALYRRMYGDTAS